MRQSAVVVVLSDSPIVLPYGRYCNDDGAQELETLGSSQSVMSVHFPCSSPSFLKRNRTHSLESYSFSS